MDDSFSRAFHRLINLYNQRQLDWRVPIRDWQAILSKRDLAIWTMTLRNPNISPAALIDQLKSKQLNLYEGETEDDIKAIMLNLQNGCLAMLIKRLRRP